MADIPTTSNLTIASDEPRAKYISRARGGAIPSNCVVLFELTRLPIFLLLVSAALLLVRLFHIAHSSYPLMSAENVAFGRTEAPFHLRLLAPMLAHFAHELCGVGTFQHWHFVVQFSAALSALAGIYVFVRQYCSSAYALGGLTIAPLVLLWSLDMPAADGYPQVFFFAVAFLALARRAPMMFAVTFIVAVTNRETIAVLLLPFVIVFSQKESSRRESRMSWAPLVNYVFFMLAWLVVWKLWLGPVLSPAKVDNKLAVFRFWSNLGAFTEWGHTLNPFAKNPFSLLGYTWMLVPFAWRALPALPRLLCWCFIPYYVLMLFVANLSETRVFMEWTPLAVLVCTAALRRLFDEHAGSGEPVRGNQANETIS